MKAGSSINEQNRQDLPGYSGQSIPILGVVCQADQEKYFASNNMLISGKQTPELGAERKKFCPSLRSGTVDEKKHYYYDDSAYHGRHVIPEQTCLQRTQAS